MHARKMTPGSPISSVVAISVFSFEAQPRENLTIYYIYDSTQNDRSIFSLKNSNINETIMEEKIYIAYAYSEELCIRVDAP